MYVRYLPSSNVTSLLCFSINLFVARGIGSFIIWNNNIFYNIIKVEDTKISLNTYLPSYLLRKLFFKWISSNDFDLDK